MKGEPISTCVDKVTYVIAHPELLQLSDRALVEALKKARLVSASTYWRDVRPDKIRKQVAAHLGAEAAEEMGRKL